MTGKKLSRRDFMRLSALMGAGLAAGCVPAGTAQPGVGVQPPPAATPAAGATAPLAETSPAAAPAASDVSGSLSFWNMPFVTQEVPPSYVQQWQEAVAQALPNVTVDTFYGPGDYGPLRQRYLLQANSGTPDVVEGLLEDEAVYVTNGLIEPLDERFEAWEDSDQFITATIDALRINGQLYGIPYNTNARGLAVRTDLLDEFGLSVPTTWTEMVEAGRAITEGTNREVYGYFTCTLVGDPRAPQEFISWYFQVSNGQPMFDTSGDSPVLMATAEQFEQILTLYSDVLAGDFPAMDPNQRGTGWPVEDPGFANGRWAMAPMGPWLWGRRSESEQARDILENRTQIVSLPLPEGGGQFTYLEVKPIMMNSFSQNKDAAWELIKFICSRDQMGLWTAGSGGIPAREDSLTIPAFQGEIANWVNGFAALLPQGVALEAVNWGPVNEANMRAVNAVIYDQQTPAEAAQALVEEINSLIAEGTV